MQVHLRQFEQQFIQGRSDAEPLLTWSCVQLRRYQNYLYALPKEDQPPIPTSFTWNLREPFTLARNLGVLMAKKVEGRGIRCNILQAEPILQVRFRQGGEVIQLAGSLHHRKLKKYWQEWKIPPWERDRIPLLYLDERLAQVLIGTQNYVADEFMAKKGEQGWVVGLYDKQF